jgi:hypothetical protein
MCVFASNRQYVLHSEFVCFVCDMLTLRLFYVLVCLVDIDQLFSRIVVALFGRFAHSLEALMRIVRSSYHDSYGRTPFVEHMKEVVNWSDTFKDDIIMLTGIKTGKPCMSPYNNMCLSRVCAAL